MAQHRPVLLRLAGDLRDLLFPPRCVGCDDLLPPFSHPPTVLCPVCRARWDEARARAAEAAAGSALQGHAYLTFYRPGEFDGVPERLIYHLKHQGDRRTFDFAAEALSFSTSVSVAAAEERAESVSATLPPLVTYPPRRRAAVSRDGFDQAARLAKAVARAINGEYATLLRRTRTVEEEQKTLTATERSQNATASYALACHASDRISGRTVILCDDLSTTGATLAACETLLMDAGARAVLWVTVAQTTEAQVTHP